MSNRFELRTTARDESMYTAGDTLDNHGCTTHRRYTRHIRLRRLVVSLRLHVVRSWNQDTCSTPSSTSRRDRALRYNFEL